MRTLIVTVHLLALRWQDMFEQAQTARRQHPERGSVTIEQVAWAVGIIAIVAIAIAAIQAYVRTQVGKLN
jgi:heme/copper-type cytochrome/quinol oxidase subunit 2